MTRWMTVEEAAEEIGVSVPTLEATISLGERGPARERLVKVTRNGRVVAEKSLGEIRERLHRRLAIERVWAEPAAPPPRKERTRTPTPSERIRAAMERLRRAEAELSAASAELRSLLTEQLNKLSSRTKAGLAAAAREKRIGRPRALSLELVEKALALREQGKSIRQIERELGRPRSTIRNALERYDRSRPRSS